VTVPDRVVAPTGRWQVVVDHAARAAEAATAIVIALLIVYVVVMLNP
jgi:hypothetical protein